MGRDILLLLAQGSLRWLATTGCDRTHAAIISSA
jgi:hypothetical protein